MVVVVMVIMMIVSTVAMAASMPSGTMGQIRRILHDLLSDGTELLHGMVVFRCIRRPPATQAEIVQNQIVVGQAVLSLQET